MNTTTSTNKSPWIFFLLVFVLTIPFWLLSTVLRVGGLPDNLPVTDIGATFVPLIAAAILIYREEGFAGVKRLLIRTFDFGRIDKKLWYLPIIFLMPLLYLLTYVIMRWVGLPVPTEWHISPMIIVVFLAFFFAAAGEELGYMGYAIDPMQKQMGALTAALIMGTLWAIWHYPSMIELGQPAGLMIFGTLFTIAIRVLNVWLYNNTGASVFAVILFHAIGNTSRTAFPGGRPAFEIADAAVGYSLVIIAAVVVVFLWGTKTLAKYRYAKKSTNGLP
jgi:membrane protease YdiL (CAAX protease family)